MYGSHVGSGLVLVILLRDFQLGMLLMSTVAMIVCCVCWQALAIECLMMVLRFVFLHGMVMRVEVCMCW